jgi:glycosyltransferase involved in cell wall biosynthesis
MRQILFDNKNDLVGFDCLALPEKFSGAAYYIYHLAKNLLELPRPFSMAIFCKPQHAKLFETFLGEKDRIIPIPLKNRVEQLFFYEYRLQKILLRDHIKVFYATHYICPPPSEHYYLVSTFHDMGFLLHPQYYPIVKRFYFGSRMKTFLQRADRLVAISQSTATSIEQRFPEYAAKISVIYPGADHFSKNHSREFMPEIKTPYMLAVNTFEKRKNILFIIRVFNHLKAQRNLPHQLLLIGQPANGFNEVQKAINRSPFKNDIVVAHSISTGELSYYYRYCDFFINASGYEGFGFTPFEALNHQCPVFLLKNNTVAEFLGDHPCILDNLDETRWAECIYREMGDSFNRKISPEAIKHLTWRNTASATLQMLDQFILNREMRLVS